jgi:predicted RNase H-like HicB family nuclease
VKIREVIALLEAEGWFLVTTRPVIASSSIPARPAGLRSQANPLTTLRLERSTVFSSRPRSSENHNMRYAVVIEKADNNYSAYVPDLPGCVATGATVEEVEHEIKEAIRFHIDGIREDGLPIPQPSAVCEYVEA